MKLFAKMIKLNIQNIPNMKVMIVLMNIFNINTIALITIVSSATLMMARRMDIMNENEITRSRKSASPELLQLCCQDQSWSNLANFYELSPSKRQNSNMQYILTCQERERTKVKISVGEISFTFSN